MGRQATEDILEVGEGVDVVVLAGADQGVEDCRRSAATVASQERPVAAADRLGTEHPLGQVIALLVARAGVDTLGYPLRLLTAGLSGRMIHKFHLSDGPCAGGEKGEHSIRPHRV